MIPLAFAAASAQAETTVQSAQLSTSGTESKWFVNYRWELDQTDHGFLKTDADTPSKTTSTQLINLKLGNKGKLNDHLDYVVRYDFAKPGVGKDGLEYANVTYWILPELGFKIGKDRINQAGWDPKEPSYTRLTPSPYLEMAGKSTGQPFSSEAALTSLQYKLGDVGTLTAQLTDDVVKTSATSRAQWNSTNLQPASTFEYAGQFGVVSPLLQVGSYDINHSKYYVLGVKADVSDIHTTLDYVIDNKSVQITADEKGTTKITSAAWNLDYTIPKAAKPFLKVVSYNVNDAKEDIKGNSAFDSTKTTGSAYEASPLTDNAMIYTVGAWCLANGDMFKPYIAFTSKNAKFLKGATGDDTESKTETHIRFGVGGEF